MDKIVVVGTGQGGFQVAASLRQQGFAGAITLIGDEPDLPYQRPPPSKNYLTEGDADRLLLRPQAYFSDQNIEIRQATKIAAIDRVDSVVETTTGDRIEYDHLILATGSRNRLPPISGLDGSGVCWPCAPCKTRRFCGNACRQCGVSR